MRWDVSCFAFARNANTSESISNADAKPVATQVYTVHYEYCRLTAAKTMTIREMVVHWPSPAPAIHEHSVGEIESRKFAKRMSRLWREKRNYVVTHISPVQPFRSDCHKLDFCFSFLSFWNFKSSSSFGQKKNTIHFHVAQCSLRPFDMLHGQVQFLRHMNYNGTRRIEMNE